jgi:hypothetical protein
VPRASGIPCSLCVFEGLLFEQLGHFVPRERERVSTIMSRPILRDAAARLLRMRSLRAARYQTLMMRRRVSAVSNHEAPPRVGTTRKRRTAIRSPILTIFWHCGFAAFSFRTRLWARPGNEPSTVLAEDCAVSGSGNADLRRKVRSSGGGGPGRPSSCARFSAAAHPADRRASAS